MSLLTNLSDDVRKELVNLASKHQNFETFLQDITKLAETSWHNARQQGLVDLENAGEQAVADAGNDLDGTPVDSDPQGA